MRKIAKMIKGKRAVDGAGVKLIRVLGNDTTHEFDPFLMMDSFDSVNPDDYIKGFPMHPHRGIETITYLIEGRIDHQDSLGNSGSINSGELQWMTAGSGILHEEMPKPASRMLGLQVWLNLPADQKMCPPSYFAITKDMITIKHSQDATYRIISGELDGVSGAQAPHISARIIDIEIHAGKSVRISTPRSHTVYVFLISGSAIIDSTAVEDKTAVLFAEGDSLEISASQAESCRLLYFEAPRLNEPIAWGGPIVMNTREELEQAFYELQTNTFIKHR